MFSENFLPNSSKCHTSAFWLPPSCANTAATLFPFASLIAPRRFPAYAPTISPGMFAMMKPRPAPQMAPSQAHHGACRCTSGRRSYESCLYTGCHLQCTQSFAHLLKHVGEYVVCIWSLSGRSTWRLPTSVRCSPEHTSERVEEISRGIRFAGPISGAGCIEVVVLPAPLRI